MVRKGNVKKKSIVLRGSGKAKGRNNDIIVLIIIMLLLTRPTLAMIIWFSVAH